MGRADQARIGRRRWPVHVTVYAIIAVLILSGIFLGDCFAKQWKLEDACDNASSVAAKAGTTDLFALQTAVNNYTLSLKNLNGFRAVVTVVNGDQSVTVRCARRVKPKLSGLFQFKDGINQTAKSTTTRVFG